MSPLSRRQLGLLEMTVAITMLATGSALQAQNDDVVLAPEAVQAQPNVVLTTPQFDQLVFAGRPASAIEAQLVSHLTLKIDELDRLCDLSSEQRSKLRLAGQGDIRRYFHGIDEKRRQYVNVPFEGAQFIAVRQEIVSLPLGLRTDQFGGQTLFAKTLSRQLSDSQRIAYEKYQDKRELARYRIRIRLIISMLDRAVSFNEEQRRRFTEITLAETRPPKRMGPHEYYAVMLQLSKIPEQKLKPIFDDAQWRVIKQHFAQAQGMEPFLKNNGYLAGLDANAKPAAPANQRLRRHEPEIQQSAIGAQR